MPDHYPPINPKFPHFLHGGDYNPDQWSATPEVWDEDMRLMKLAHCNAMSVAIFSWTSLEPEEGRFEFGWLDAIMDKLAEHGGFAVLATPSGARPAWMSRKYPEVLRVNRDGRREFHHTRHNHCRTSPVYREKCRIINARLAERYKDHPALLVWHISNEYNGGDCHCDLCLNAFRNWLRIRYHDDLDELNQKWWAGFWSHTITDWEDIRPIDYSVHGMTLDWKRFLTEQTIDFYKAEIAPLGEFTPQVPITTNFMGLSTTLDYWKFAREVDVVSWDSYPWWHKPGNELQTACATAFTHDINRCLKGGKPFMLMESVPSVTNWAPVCKLKRPGMHLLSSLHAVAHGSDTVQYFQWRKGRGGSEKFHGAVVDHVGHENTRVFRDVAGVGMALEKMDGVIGTTVRPQVAIVYDWETRWAMDEIQGLGRDYRGTYAETCIAHYSPFWKAGIPVDVIDQTCDISRYKLFITPMLYMLRPGMAEKLEKFVREGGTWVATYWTGIVDESDLCYLGGWPGGGLRKVLGIWDEETDATHPEERNCVRFGKGPADGMKEEYEARELFALIHAEGAKVLATYGRDFYAGRPAVTVNKYGKGRAYYVASRNSNDFLCDFLGAVSREIGIRPILDGGLPDGVSVQKRGDGEREFVFVMNFNAEQVKVALGDGEYHDVLAGGRAGECVELGGYGVGVYRRMAKR
ncbi:MAG TPA: beta-galactosidase [Candidatus Brocadiia bacterium]|nr:beta-galactosidase [Candidatus Brocadiia bacterium]